MEGLTTLVLLPRNPDHQEDRKKFHAIRRVEYCDKLGRETPETETDAHDAHAPFVVVKEAGKIIAGCRIVSRRSCEKSGLELPLQHELPNVALPTGDIAEVSRVIILPEARRRLCVDLLLYASIFRVLLEGEYTAMVALIRERYFRVVNHRFPEFFQLLSDESWEHCGEVYVPATAEIPSFRRHALTVIPRLTRSGLSASV